MNKSTKENKVKPNNQFKEAIKYWKKTFSTV